MELDNEHIDELLIAYLLGELDVNAQKVVEQWMESSPDNKAKYQEVEQIWGAAEGVELNFDADAAWNTTAARLQEQHFVLKHWKNIAASVVLFMASLGAYMYLHNVPETMLVYAQNGPVQDTLSDGSTMRLNQYAEVSYLSDFNDKTREVVLKGEAFFQIKRDTTKAFIVHTPDSKIEVLGTSFNIQAVPTDSLVTVFVQSGVVRFSYLSDLGSDELRHIRLQVGEKVTYNTNSKKLVKSTNNSQNQLDTYWVNQQLSFDGTRLKEVVAALEKIFEVEIVLGDAQLGNCRVTVDFEKNSLEEMLLIIASTFDLELKTDNNKFTLYGTACENK